ncbi:MAG TPA: YhjD/YihY/BrkB family envelope integrity protein [Gaiellaceae bacterium]|nr:YhjD/YihY/BrkB family envelope integrity protein [Gaiellaceae bacterium]
MAVPSDTPPQPPAGEGRRGRLAAVRALARAAPARLSAARGRHASVDASFDLFERDRRLAASVLAGGVAFRFFFWLLPLALILGGVLGFASGQAADEIAGNSGLTGAAASAVGEASEAAARGRWALLLTGVATLLWTSTKSVQALRRVYALVWNVPPPRAGNPLVDALLFSGICIVTIVVPAGAARLRDLSPGPGIGITIVAFVAFFGIWLLVSWWLPHGDAPLRALVPGAVLFAAAAHAVHLFTVFYVAVKLERASTLYGGLGLAATVLFVLYLLGRLVVASAILNAELWRRGSPG